jgi:hypothetical protein
MAPPSAVEVYSDSSPTVGVDCAFTETKADATGVTPKLLTGWQGLLEPKPKTVTRSTVKVYAN